MDEFDQALDDERTNGDRLAAVLRTALSLLRADDRDDLMASIIGPSANQLTVGHVVDGALALHDRLSEGRPE